MWAACFKERKEEVRDGLQIEFRLDESSAVLKRNSSSDCPTEGNRRFEQMVVNKEHYDVFKRKKSDSKVQNTVLHRYLWSSR